MIRVVLKYSGIEKHVGLCCPYQKEGSWLMTYVVIFEQTRQLGVTNNITNSARLRDRQ